MYYLGFQFKKNTDNFSKALNTKRKLAEKLAKFSLLLLIKTNPSKPNNFD